MPLRNYLSLAGMSFSELHKLYKLNEFMKKEDKNWFKKYNSHKSKNISRKNKKFRKK